MDDAFSFFHGVIMRRTEYQVYYKPLSPFALIGFILLGLAFFFLTLPIFLAALAVFSAAAAYFAWRIKRTMKEMERELMRRQQQDASCVNDYSGVIDITPEPEEKGEDRRNI